MSFKVICVDDKNRPKEIPVGDWVEKDELYTVVAVLKMARQGNALGFVLEEIKPPENCPYDTYHSRRFRPATEDDVLAQEAVSKLLEEVLENELIHI